jgi:DNA (cytosine-5)-methyltransferase 1
MLTHFSLFTGIGGIDLAAEWVGFTTVGQVEWADYPTKVLEKHWPDVPRWRDIRSVTKESFTERTGLQTVDLISGGFPCQPFSVAGKQKGKEDNRYLWPEMLRVIREIKPNYILGENVPGILRIAGKTVCENLEREGYAVTVFNYEAAAVGAKHRRERIFFVGHSKHDVADTKDGNKPKLPEFNNREEQQWDAQGGHGTGASSRSTDGGVAERTKINKGASAEISKDVADTNRDGTQWDKSEYGQRRRIEQDSADVADTQCKRQQGQGEFVLASNPKEVRQRETNKLINGCVADKRTAQSCLGRVASRIPAELDGYWRVEPDIPRVATGIKNRVGRLKCLGNAVVPQQIYPVLKAIAEIEKLR